MPRTSTKEQRRVLPPTLPPRGLSRIEAAAFIGISPTLFDELVDDGRMPPPKLINSRVIWDRAKVEAYFEALPERAAGPSDPNSDSFADWT